MISITDESPVLFGDYLGAGACGFAFFLEGDDKKVIKVARMIDYKYGEDGELEVSSIKDDQQRNLGNEWLGGVALNEFQAVLFEKLAEMTILGEEYTTTLPKTYAFTSGEMTSDMIEDLKKSEAKYNWGEGKLRQILNGFYTRDAQSPGSRIGLWVIEKLERGAAYEKRERDTDKARQNYEHLNGWLINHNMIVRDTRNEGNYGIRENGQVAWFDPASCPWPIEKEYANSPDIRLQNLYYGFGLGFAGTTSQNRVNQKIDEYANAIEANTFVNKWWQAEEERDVVLNFLAEAEVIGEYIDAGAAGSVYALNGDKVLKIVRLNHKFHDEDINKDQAEFIEDVYLDKMKEGKPINEHFVDIYHYNRGDATKELTEIVNKKAQKAHSKIKTGEPIALWIMERLPNVGDEYGRKWDDAKQQGMMELRSWARSKGYEINDLHSGNYGSRNDGTWVAFDPWPKRG